VKYYRKLRGGDRPSGRCERPPGHVKRDVRRLTSLVISRRETEAAAICRLAARLTLRRAGRGLARDTLDKRHAGRRVVYDDT